ncbi:MAG: hypothetical protein AAF063_29570 [Cyanobacteria bacterium J06643_5]
MLSNLDISAIFQTIKDFYQNHKEFINSLFSGGGILSLSGSFVVWLRWRHRKSRIPVNTFAFNVINPQSENLKQQIYGGKYDDSLADHNIPYQQRIGNVNIRKELEQLLQDNRWLLISGRSGIGKTREAVELAERYNNLG